MINLLLTVLLSVNAEVVCKETVKPCATCCPKAKVKTIVKEIEKPIYINREVKIETVHHVEDRRLNHLSLIVGVGALGNLKEDINGLNRRISTENGPVYGLQYLRELDVYREVDVNLLIMIQTNRTASLGAGVSF